MKGPRRATEATDSGGAVSFNIPQAPDLVFFASIPGDNCAICRRPGDRPILYALTNVADLPIVGFLDPQTCERCARGIERQHPPTMKRLRRRVWPFALDVANEAVDEMLLEHAERRGAA